MTAVASGASMSLDGFIADPSGDVGPLFEWYFNGDVEIPTAGPWVFKVSEPSARVIRRMMENCGALVVGRGEFDKTHGWGGRHPMGAPVFVLTHEPPAEWPFPDTPEAEDMPFTYVTDGIASAIAQAEEVAGDKTIAVNPGVVAGQALEAGLLEEVWISLVPVWLGEGIPYFGPNVRKLPAFFETPTVVEAPGVTHLTYHVRRG
jgi:dihydrofolate reductase